jgi:hypothetical protein
LYNGCTAAPYESHSLIPIPQNVLAKMVIERVPSVEMVRFVSSGTEACLSVLRLMRAFTKREKVIKFVGCYHGHADSFLVKAGSGVATLGLPDSPGGWLDGGEEARIGAWNNDGGKDDGGKGLHTPGWKFVPMGNHCFCPAAML